MLELLRDLWTLLPKRKFAWAGVEVGLVTLFFLLLAVALTWPVIGNLDEVLVGGGELGGWFWRQWWHFSEVTALASSELGPLDHVAALIGLGRYPETGNILDVLLISYPFDHWFGWPAHHNLKVLVILIGNGVCGYALARAHTESRVVAAAAAVIAVVNPIVFQDVDKTGLRQVLLWWLLLYPVFLGRAERTLRTRDALLAGVMFGLTAAFYWFYGLFAAMFTVVRIGAWLVTRRPKVGQVVRVGAWYTLAGALVAGFFLLPYITGVDEGAQQGGGGGSVAALPELTFFLEFPAYDTIASAPLRPTSYRDNVLSSLHRTIDSAWPADYVLDPRHGVKALPIVVLFAGVVPAFFVRRARTWLFVWLLFWLGTLGPFLKLGAQKDTAEVVMFGEYVVRLPFVLMFQFVPGMSRMFAPYRMGAMVVVASVGVLAVVLDALPRKVRPWLAGIVLVGGALQPFYRFDLGPVGDPNAAPSMWRVPTTVSGFQIPDWYEQLDPEGWEGIIELPLEQQQDLLCAYQVFHRRKVYRSWATLPAIPSEFRKAGGGEVGKRMRWLAAPEPNPDRAEETLRSLSRDPLTADIDRLEDDQLQKLMDKSEYRWVVVHERGYYLQNPGEGPALYRAAVRLLSERLGMEPLEVVEQQKFDWPGKLRNFPQGPAWVPWASQEVQLPAEDFPRRYFMAVFDLSEWTPTPDSE